jgi:hypothetical protein
VARFDVHGGVIGTLKQLVKGNRWWVDVVSTSLCLCEAGEAGLYAPPHSAQAPTPPAF